ncbi:MAG: PilN domain-containing protein [Halofilum sp. (in: g-proteobacteria)]|nr:PilN domain-containing protein [Halofilum sp. (in: g-proteobacteria)]
MAKINLLPWREERRKQLTQEFARQAVLGAVLAAAVGGYGWYHVNGLIEQQEQRNSYLQEQIAVLQEEIKEIRELEQTKQRLLARMNVIQRLQQRRPQIVHLFSELAATLPDGVYLTSVTQSGDDLTLKGRAESNARVSAYMRNLGSSPWLKNPRLEVIETGQNEQVNSFTLHLAQTTPDDDQDDASQSASSDGASGTKGG